MIVFNENKKSFVINTPNTSYSMRIDKLGILRNLYYGKRLNDASEVSMEIDGVLQPALLPARTEYITKEAYSCNEPSVFAIFSDGTRD